MTGTQPRSTLCLALGLGLGLTQACAGFQGPAAPLDGGLAQATDDAGRTVAPFDGGRSDVHGDAGPGRQPPDAGLDFHSCADAGVLHYCPGMGEELCRLEVLRAAFASGCSADLDCIKADYVPNCLAHGLCELRPAVLSSRKSEFEAAISAELDWYCGGVSCALGGSCVVMQTRAVCEQGACLTR